MEKGIHCPHCNCRLIVIHGKTKDGYQRYRYKKCNKTFSDKTTLFSEMLLKKTIDYYRQSWSSSRRTSTSSRKDMFRMFPSKHDFPLVSVQGTVLYLSTTFDIREIIYSIINIYFVILIYT